jgi:hypothetical protein
MSPSNTSNQATEIDANLDWDAIADHSNDDLFNYLASIASRLSSSANVADPGDGLEKNESGRSFSPLNYPTIDPQSNSEFLKDIAGRDKRILSAMHKAYCFLVKEEHEKRQKNKRSRNEAIQKLSGLADSSQTDCNPVAMTTMVRLNEPQVLRSSMYRKFVLQYQHYYNAQDAEKLVSSVMLPCCSHEVIRQNKLWAKVRATNVTNGGTGSRMVVIQDTTFIA